MQSAPCHPPTSWGERHVWFLAYVVFGLVSVHRPIRCGASGGRASGDGWGFWEPSMKYIKFMLDRGEKTRLETSVLFTDRGILEIKKDPKYATLPSWISTTTPDGDKINDFARELVVMFFVVFRYICLAVLSDISALIY